MSWLVSFYKSTIGMKVAMAVSGVILAGFTLVHMLGNLQVFLGADALNNYSRAMQSNLPVLWGVRLLLLGSILLHMYSAVILTLRSSAARPVRYKAWRPLASTYASRTMTYGGLIIVLFLVYHLMHFTVGNVHPSFRAGFPYQNVLVGFNSLPVVLVYVLANLALGVHLYHGLYSLTRSLGLSNARYSRLARGVATAFAVVVASGNVFIPIAVHLRLFINA